MTNTADMEKQPLLDEQHEPEPEASLSELQQQVREAQRKYWRAWSRTTSGRWHKRVMISVTAFLTFFMLFMLGVIVMDFYDDDDEWHLPEKVQLEAHIMSKCPDARDCLRDMILPAMQNVSHKVDFKLSYIGTCVSVLQSDIGGKSLHFLRTTQDDDGVRCKHGEEECLGNMIELCAAHINPDPKVYLGFTMCMTRDYEDIPKRELVEDCALEHGISMQHLNDCMNKDDGSMDVKMLQASFNRSADAGVTKSCTVRLNGNVRCIRDGGEWKECEGGSKAEDLVSDILDLSEMDW